MSIRIDVRPELEAELAKRASALGVNTEAYAASLLEQAVETLPPAAGHLSAEDLRGFLHEMARYSDKIPVLPDEALTREALYQDHD